MEHLRNASSQGNPVRVVTVDDFEPFLQVAREVVLAAPGFEPTREVTSGPQALAAAAELAPDLMIVDIHMPGMSGVEVTRRIRAANPDVVVMLISTSDPTDLSSETRECGAACIVRKQDFDSQLLAHVWQRYGRRGPAG